MVINLSPAAADPALNTIATLAAGGSLELLSDEGGLLAALSIPAPAAEAAVDGEIEFREIKGEAVSAGRARAGRIVAPGGDELITFDVGDAKSNAMLKFPSAQLAPGDPIAIKSFRLVMP